MQNNKGTMYVSDAERLQLAHQRHEANLVRLRELRMLRDKIPCTKKSRCYILPVVSKNPCDVCKAAGWLLFEWMTISARVKTSADYLRRAVKRNGGK